MFSPALKFEIAPHCSLSRRGAWAVFTNMVRGLARKTIQIPDIEVVIDHATGEPSRVVFPRHWARVKIRRPKSPLHRGRLVIESHGRKHAA